MVFISGLSIVNESDMFPTSMLNTFPINPSPLSRNLALEELMKEEESNGTEKEWGWIWGDDPKGSSVSFSKPKPRSIEGSQSKLRSLHDKLAASVGDTPGLLKLEEIRKVQM
jgi:hypothetical protein